MAKRYAWGDGKGRVHSRPKRSRTQLRAAVQAKAQERDPLYDPTQQLSGSRLAKATDDLVGLEFDPQRKALDAEAAQTRTQGAAVQGRASDYFRQLAESERGNVERGQAIGNLLNDRIAEIGTQTNAGIDKAEAQSAAALGDDAAVRGPGLDGGSTALAEELAAARARAGENTQRAGQDAASATAAYGGLADLSRQARELRGGETVQQLANAQQAKLFDVDSRRAALEAQVGPKRTETLLGLRQSGFENAATAAGLDLKREDLQAQVRESSADQRLAQMKLRATNRQNRARNKLTQKQIDATVRGQDKTAEQKALDRASRERLGAADRTSRERIAKARRKGKTLESADAKKVKTGIANAFADLTAGGKMQFDGKTYTNPTKFLRDQGAPGIVIRAALERKQGGLKLSTVAELKRLGIRVPRSWIGAYKGPPTPP
jgi:hypothetical protein